MKAVGGLLDFTLLYGGYGFKPLAPGRQASGVPRRGSRFSHADLGRVCYAFARIHVPREGKLLIGAGADWGMRWFLDGKLIFDALRDDATARRRGYFRPQPCSIADELFSVAVTPGDHVLAVMVSAGSRGWALTSACVSEKAGRLLPVATGKNPNLPNLEKLIWGYLSVTDGLVLGSYNVPVQAGQPAESHLLWRSESKAVFALEKRDGSLRWIYSAKPGRVVSNIEIAFGDGRLFLIDGTAKADLVAARRRGQPARAKLTLVALELKSGSILWEQDDVPLLAERSMPTRLNSNITHLFMGLPNWAHLSYRDGVVLYGCNAAYEAKTGKLLWRRGGKPGKLPVIHDGTVITGSTAYDLRTGKQRMVEDILTGERVPWRHIRAYGCGPVMGCEHLLFFRSGVDGFYDLDC
ncbi:MAG TPA: hypothetical protein EYP14_12085, partial [Planctomycetaceae bacterium]|nr:hypothetical protein [Planctomycetaceae bacterium]